MSDPKKACVPLEHRLSCVYTPGIPQGTPDRSGPGGGDLRPASGLWVCLISAQPTWSPKRYRITANWARVAVPVGSRVPLLVPPTMLLATDHCMGSTA